MNRTSSMAALTALSVFTLTACTSWLQTGGDASESSSSANRSVRSLSSISASYASLAQLDRQKVEAYVGSHINALAHASPSVLGGSFSVESIEWYTGSTAIVTFTDGSKTVQARMTATVDSTGVHIVSFEEFSEE